ncbi:MAG: hypothetical protein K8953_02775 [Proteobacteria bacterium]|nr:hypothetical protein [Pseudomonadota bacterium]
MATEARIIYDDIVRYTKAHGGSFSTWYCGITHDKEQRLFKEHNVARSGSWICHPCSNDNIARTVEKALIDTGYDGGTGGGDSNTVIVYAYKITATTKR